MKHRTAKEFKIRDVCIKQPWDKLCDVTHVIRARIGPLYYTTRAFSGIAVANLETSIINALRNNR